MATIFTKIIERELPAHIIKEDEKHIAFLDIFPKVQGHTLIIPKVPIENFFDLSAEQMSALMAFTKSVRNGLRKTITCNRIGMLVLGLEVPHAHIHLLPIDKESDLAFAGERARADDNFLAELATALQQACL